MPSTVAPPLATPTPSTWPHRPAASWLLWGTAVVWGVNAVALASAGLSPWWHAAMAAIGNVLQLAVVAAAAWWTARRGATGTSAGSDAPLVVRHVAVGVAASLAAVALSLVGPRLPHPASAQHAAGPGPNAGWLFWWFLFLYGAVAATTHAELARVALRARELEAARAELRALRAQLDPHFLFNALHSMGVLVRTDPPAAEDAIERLGDLLRYVLRAGRAVRPAAEGDALPADVAVPLDAELAFVRDYLALERIRFGPRLRVDEAIAPGTGCALVPALVLQPLVENAVKHAVGPRRLGATVRLVAERVADPQLGAALRLGVVDDGPGACAEGTARAGERIGLAGLRERLAASYPARHRLEVSTPDSGGFAVWLLLPWRTGEAAPARPRAHDARATSRGSPRAGAAR
ncbi:MAG TPA: histidine kinase [Gemmatirosa sp.]|nr:histidine kinase [Gemmatirosa sp.]